MVEVAATIFIHRSIDQVFAYLKDFKRIPQWQADVTEVVGDFYQPVVIGTIFTEVVNFFGRRSYTMRVISEHQPQNLIIQCVEGPFLLSTQEFYCAEKSGVTRITFRTQIIPTTFLFKVLLPLFKISLNKKWKDNLASLKQNLETTVLIQKDKKQLAIEAF